MKSEYVRLGQTLDPRTLALAVKIADSCAASDLECNLPWVGPDDEGVAGEVPRGEHWYDTTDPEAKDEEWLADALRYLDARKLLRRKEGAPHLVRVHHE